MENRNKNKKISFADLIRYGDDKMNGEERNAFERELQKDPFTDEAAEGFSMISPEKATDDMSELKKRLKKVTRQRSLYIYYRIAAAVAVLALISSVYVISRHEKQPVTLSQNISQVAKAPVPVTGPEKPKAQTISPAAAEKVISKPAMAKRAEHNEISATDEIILPEIKEPEMKEAETVNPDLVITTDNDITNRMLVPPKASDAALSERKAEEAKSAPVRNYESPQPVCGRDSFNLYIEKNIRNPEPGNTMQQVVILSFLVRRDSTISQIRILSTPGDEYSREAVRLIKEGPVWKPAMENSRITEESVSVNIVF